MIHQWRDPHGSRSQYGPPKSKRTGDVKPSNRSKEEEHILERLSTGQRDGEQRFSVRSTLAAGNGEEAVS
jgi:hypothetical protein